MKKFDKYFQIVFFSFGIATGFVGIALSVHVVFALVSGLIIMIATLGLCGELFQRHLRKDMKYWDEQMKLTVDLINSYKEE